MREDIEEIRKLELEYLKNLDPKDVLTALGITDWREYDGYLHLKSPLREDKHPSFGIFYGTERGCWIYHDSGGNRWRGTSIDLWMAVRNVDYVTAVREMREVFGINLLEENTKDLKELKKKIAEETKREIEKQKRERKRLSKSEKEVKNKVKHRILRINEPKHPAMLELLKERGIREIPDWLKEIHYLHLDSKKHYFGLAVEDESGVWHVRSKYGKVNVRTFPFQEPTFSLLKRREGNRKVIVVEGLFDALTVNQMWDESYDIVILNSTSLVDRLLKSGVLEGYDEVILALDDDDFGREAEREICETYLGDIRLKKLILSTGKDVNECYLSNGTFKVREISWSWLEGGAYRREEKPAEREREQLRKVELPERERERNRGKWSPGL